MDWYALFDKVNIIKPINKKIKQINLLGNNLLLLLHVLRLLCYHLETIRYYFLPEFITRIVRNFFWVYCDDRIFGNNFYKDKTIFEVLSIDSFFVVGYVFDLLSVCAIWVEEELFDDCVYCESDFIYKDGDRV